MRRLLIANRGEIACRIARTAHGLGIETIGVHSEADADALHVDVVGRSVHLGGSSPAESYLRAEAVIEAARRTGCDAVHPGYGFLAENASFARAVIEAGLIWVGPTPEQIELLGDKMAAKRAAIAAGVPTTDAIEVAPGQIPAGIAMPALVKAAAGGGGRGMRVVRSPEELAEAVESASREAVSAFGDGTVFVEPFLEKGRHVEVQIIGDAHGRVIHLGERECSIQRRNQKVIEEAPSPGISEQIRQILCDGAVALARSVGYQGAGTVEYMVGEDGTITFLEVNTRLQVEHPVTEAITGLDLVELQLRVACGEPLPVTQGEVSFSGHAIEARLVAEDPAAGWLPTTGRIGAFRLGPGVRVDTGVRVGSVVTSDYDSLLAKVIAHGPDRSVAARRLDHALCAAAIEGLSTNREALVTILVEPDFVTGATTTDYLDTHPGVSVGICLEPDDRMAMAIAAAVVAEADDRSADEVTGFAPAGWRNVWTQGRRQIWSDGLAEHHLELTGSSGRRTVLVGRPPEPDETGALAEDRRRHLELVVRSLSDDRVAIELDGIRTTFDIDRVEDRLVTTGPIGSLTWHRVPTFVEHGTDKVGAGPICPLPGTVIAVHVAPGDQVSEGQLLMVVEAMKMEHRITAAAEGRVVEVRFAEGERVDAGDLLVALDASEEG